MKKLIIVGVIAALGVLLVVPSLGVNAKTSWHIEPASSNRANSLNVELGADVSQSGDVSGLSLLLANPSDTLLTIVWDESAVVLNGISEKLIHTGVLTVSTAVPQSPTPIAPHAVASEAIWPASLVTPGRVQTYRLSGDFILKLYLTIQGAADKHTELWAWRFIATTQEEPPFRLSPFWTWLIVIWLGVGLVGYLFFSDPR